MSKSTTEYMFCEFNRMPSNLESLSPNDSSIIDWVKSSLKGGTPVVVIDIDDCIRDTSGRSSLLPNEEEVESYGAYPNFAYTKFNNECGGDYKKTENVKKVAASIPRGAIVLFLTSCTATPTSATATIRQLHNWLPFTYDLLFMRGRDNHLFPTEFKKEFLIQIGVNKRTGKNITLFDDNKEIIDMADDLGVKYTHLVD